MVKKIADLNLREVYVDDGHLRDGGQDMLEEIIPLLNLQTHIIQCH